MKPTFTFYSYVNIVYEIKTVFPMANILTSLLRQKKYK